MISSSRSMTSSTVSTGAAVYGEAGVTTALASCWGAIDHILLVGFPLLGDRLGGSCQRPGRCRIGRTPYFRAPRFLSSAPGRQGGRGGGRSHWPRRGCAGRACEGCSTHG